MVSRKRATPPPRLDIERVSRLRVLGVIMNKNDRLTAADHVTMLLSSSSSLMYAIVRTTRRPRHCMTYFVSRTGLQYASPAWSGMCSAADRARLDSLLMRRGKRLGYCADDVPTVADLFSTADDFFHFHRVKTNSHHVLQPHLHDQTDMPYQLRIRSHNRSSINKTKFLTDADF